MAEMSQADLEKALTGVQASPTGVEPRPFVRVRPTNLESLSRQTATGEAIPLDTSSGVPFLTRLNISRAPDDNTRQAMLQKAFTLSRVEKVGEDFVIRDYMDPESGQLKDLLVDERGASWKDLADLGEAGIELLGAFAALRGGRGLTMGAAPGLARSLAESAVATTGAQVVGGASDALARSQAGVPINPLEIAQRRNVQAAKGALIDLGLTAPIAGASSFVNLRRGVSQTPEALGAVQARNRLAEDTGVSVPFSLGQQTGSERLRQSEEFLENISFGGGPQRAARLEQESQIGRLQDSLIETFGDVPARALPNKDVIGDRAVASLRQLVRGAEAGTTTARSEALAEATRDLTGALERSTGLSTRVLSSEAGTAVRTFVNLKRDTLNEIEESLKADAIKLGAGAPFIDTAAAKTQVRSLVDKAYAKPGGKPGQRLASMPENLKPILKDVADLPPNATWDDIRRVRNSANRLINQGEILGDTDTGVLKQISKSLTDSINDNLKHLPVSAGEAVKRANKFYAEGIESFQVKGITDILADPTQRKLGPFAIFDQAAKDPDQYFRLKDALTKPLMQEGKAVGPVQAGEETWNAFKQAMLTEMTEASRKTGNRALLDAGKFFGELDNLRPEVLNDLLGPNSETALRSLKRLEILDNAKLPATEALEILRQGGDDAPTRIAILAKREKELDQLYSNQVIKRFSKGEIGSESIRSGEFVDRFAESASIADIKDALNKLEVSDPGLVNLIRQKKVQSLFQKAQGNPLESEVAAKKLATEIKSPETQARLEAVLGSPGVRRLNDFMEMLAHIQRPGDKAAKMGGSMAGGGQKAQLLTVAGVIAALPKQAQYWLTGVMLANPRVNRILTGPVQPLDPTKAIRAVILSDDGLMALADEFGREAKSAAQAIVGARPAGGEMSQQELEQSLQTQ